MQLVYFPFMLNILASFVNMRKIQMNCCDNREKQAKQNKKTKTEDLKPANQSKFGN